MYNTCLYYKISLQVKIELMIEDHGRQKSLQYLQNDKNFCKIFEYVHSVNSLFIKRAEH